MNEIGLLTQIEQIGVGLALIVFPLVFVFAFAAHPGLLRPHLLGPAALVQRAHKNKLVHFGHVLVTLNTGLLIVVALHFMKVLGHGTGAWAGYLGACIAVLGAIILAADKGALCLTMSAFDTLPEKEFQQIMPGIMAMFSKKGWLKLLWGILLLPIGFTIQAIALIKSHTLSPWQGVLFLIGAILVGTPDGLEIINLSASVMMAVSLIPYGIQIISAAL
jgi:hypothetical protein